MRINFHLPLLLFAMGPWGVAAERPYANEDNSYTVEPGRFATELTPVIYARHSAADPGDVETETWNFGYSLVRVGIAPDTEIGVGFEAWEATRNYEPATGTLEHQHGAGSVVLRAKQNLVGNDGGDFACAFAPYLRLPTGSGTGKLEAPEWGFAAPADFTLSDRWSGLAVVYGDWASNSSGSGHHFELGSLLSFTRVITEQWCVLGECFYQIHPESGASPVATIDVGVGRSFPHDLYIELGAMIGITRASDDIATYVTIAKRF